MNFNKLLAGMLVDGRPTKKALCVLGAGFLFVILCIVLLSGGKGSSSKYASSVVCEIEDEKVTIGIKEGNGSLSVDESTSGRDDAFVIKDGYNIIASCTLFDKERLDSIMYNNYGVTEGMAGEYKCVVRMKVCSGFSINAYSLESRNDPRLACAVYGVTQQIGMLMYYNGTDINEVYSILSALETSGR